MVNFISVLQFVFDALQHLLISLGRDLKYSYNMLNYFTHLTSFKQIESYLENTQNENITFIVWSTNNFETHWPFFYISETTFSKQFSLHYSFCSLFKAQHCLETCVNYVWNCITPLFTPLEVQFFKTIFFKTYFEGVIWKILMRRIRVIFYQGPYKSQFA